MALSSFSFSITTVQICYDACTQETTAFNYFGTQYEFEVRPILPALGYFPNPWSVQVGAWLFIFCVWACYHAPPVSSLPCPGTVLVRRESNWHHVRSRRLHRTMQGQPRRDLRWVLQWLMCVCSACKLLLEVRVIPDLLCCYVLSRSSSIDCG